MARIPSRATAGTNRGQSLVISLRSETRTGRLCRRTSVAGPSPRVNSSFWMAAASASDAPVIPSTPWSPINTTDATVMGSRSQQTRQMRSKVGAWSPDLSMTPAKNRSATSTLS